MSELKQHNLEFCHSFDFSNIEILDQNVRNKCKREILSIHILKNNNNVNLIKEPSKIDSILQSILN